MNDKIFIDTNVIIDLFNKTTLNKGVLELKSLLRDSSKDLYINNFIIAEVLQGIKIANTTKYNEYNRLLESFKIIEVDNSIIMRSIDIYRLCKNNGTSFNNETICPIPDCTRLLYNSIDCIHYATCEAHDLKILTNDKLFNAIDKHMNKNIVLNLTTH